MRLLSSITNMKHLLLCVFLSQLWGVTDSTTVSPNATSIDPKSNTTTTMSTPTTTRPPPPTAENVQQIAQNETSITLKLTKDSNITTHIQRTAPTNVENVTQVAQNETSITLQWTMVKNFSVYILRYNDTEKNITLHQTQGEYVVSKLTAGTKYNFTLITVFEGNRSTGYNFSGVTAPRNTEEFKAVGQTETSINLQWKQVTGIHNYVLADNTTVPADLQTYQTFTVENLTSGTGYNFTLFTLFENVKSSGVTIFAVTAPENVKTVTVLNQTESSITVKWDKVKNISDYILHRDDNKNGIFTNNSSNTSVTYTIKELSAGKYHKFKLITVFHYASSTGYTFQNATVPPKVPWLNVTKRFATSITLEWENVDNNWEYFLEYNGGDGNNTGNTSSNIVSYPVTNLSAGTEYIFRVITMFSGLNSTPHEVETVTAIDCASANWHVTDTSINATIEGLFSKATATYESKPLVSPGGANVSFTGLEPGATYEIHLVYEKNSIIYTQCLHSVTIQPQKLNAYCEYKDTGYSIHIVWDKPDGVWTSVEVDVTRKNQTYIIHNPNLSHTLSGYQPATTHEVCVTSLSGSVRSETFTFQCHTDPTVVIAGSVCAAVLLCVLVFLAIFIFLKRPDIISRKKSFISGSKQSNKESKAISAAKFPDHFNLLSVDENRGFSQEYEDLSTVGTEQTRKVAILPENKVKNRFTNVLPYDWCRVKLTSSDETSDYINANYMPGYNSNREYIATQGPLPSTVNDFWRMIWEQRSKGIVMVTNCIEGGRTKCEQYWPSDSQSCHYGELMVTKRSEQQKPNWTLREFSVKHKNTSEERAVKHFHFTAWPDHGVPQCTAVLIEFRGLVRQHIEAEGSKSPTVVHCSAGVGRTGTLIALDVLLQQLQKEHAVGIKAFVHKMRLNRPYMVQTESQYVFLHHCIMDSLQPKEMPEENLYENVDMIYVNATALREFNKNKTNI